MSRRQHNRRRFTIVDRGEALNGKKPAPSYRLRSRHLACKNSSDRWTLLRHARARESTEAGRALAS